MYMLLDNYNKLNVSQQIIRKILIHKCEHCHVVDFVVIYIPLHVFYIYNLKSQYELFYVQTLFCMIITFSINTSVIYS